jgi:small subunit ribosomal protein S4
MGRYTDSRCKLCRREGAKLFLKGDRCLSDKCAFERRDYAPGEMGQRRRRKVSDYGLRLREKQKARRIYGLMEKQFRKYYAEADRMHGVTGEVLLQVLERRLDNIVFRLGMAPSRQAARQLVSHRHFTVNGRIVNVPSFRVSPGDEVAVRDRSKSVKQIKSTVERRGAQGVLPWLELDPKGMVGRMLEIPSREGIPTDIQEQFIVEYYSK